jgi:hypothetical protein
MPKHSWSVLTSALLLLSLPLASADGTPNKHNGTPKLKAANASGKPAGRPSGPSGIRLKWVGSSYETSPPETQAKLEWQAKKGAVKEQLGGHLDCSSLKTAEVELCFGGIAGYPGWYADFGEDAKGLFEARMMFFKEMFYEYDIVFDSDNFEYVTATLQKALGKTTKKSHSAVQNRMGAEFDQDIFLWDLGDVTVSVLRRGAKVTEGVMNVTYNPIGKTVPKETEGGKAPF